MKGFKINKQLLLFFTGILICFHCFSQDDSSLFGKPGQPHMLTPIPAPPEEIFYKGSIEGGGGAIIPVTNKALRTSLAGVYDLHLSGNYVLAPHIFAGLELEDVELGNTAQNVSYNTLMTMYNVGVKMGYYTYMQRDFLFCYSLSGGPSLILYSNIPTPPPPTPPGGFKQVSFFVRPDMLAAYRINDELRVGVDISVLLLGYRFDPTYSGIAQYIVYDPSKDINALKKPPISH